MKQSKLTIFLITLLSICFISMTALSSEDPWDADEPTSEDNTSSLTNDPDEDRDDEDTYIFTPSFVSSPNNWWFDFAVGIIFDGFQEISSKWTIEKSSTGSRGVNKHIER